MNNHLKSHRNWLLASAATGLVVMAAPAIAQDTDDDVEQIRVTGFRAAIESSIEAKRENTSIVEAISAEDIGKLPDVSIAESLARLPGLAAQRVRGRAQVLSVRGLGPDFTTALLNGREQVTAGDNRGVEFDQYPAELVNQVLVYKTPDAQLVASGLAGTADIQTIRPLEFGRESLTLSASYEWTSQDQLNADVDDTGHRITGTYVNQFANDTIGVVLGFANQSTPTHAENYEITGFQSDRGFRSPEAFKMFSESRELERTAVLGTLEFEPNAAWNTSIDVMYTEFTDGGIRRGVELPVATWLGFTGLRLAPTSPVIEDGLITEGVFVDAFGVGRNDVQSREAELFAFGWNTQYQLNDNWRLEGDLSFSRVERSALDFETYFGLGPDRSVLDEELAFEFTGDRYRLGSIIDYSDPSLMVLTDPGGWGQDGFNKTLSTDDELFALRGSATRDFASGPFSSIEFGAYYTQRDKERRTEEYFVDLTSGNASEPIPSQYLMSPTTLDWVGNLSVVAYDPNRLLADGVYTLRELDPVFIPNKQWQVEEDVLVLYAQANVDTTVFGAPTRGNIGLQVVDTDQSSTGPGGFNSDGITFIPGSAFSDGDSYTEVLPSANFSFEVAEDTFLRVGAARTLARARMEDMRASVNLSNDSTICRINPTTSLFEYTPDPTSPESTCVNGNSGDPSLRPYIADSFDLSLEHYFADGAGYFSVAVFHKEIDSWVFGSVARDFDATEIVDAAFGAGTTAANPGIERGRFFAPENVDGGWLQGIELSANIPGDALHEKLEGFGVFATYSVTDSEIQPGASTSPINIPGLSESLGNVTVYYERGGFEARVSNRWRDPFLAELPDFTGQPDFRNAFEESVVDAQIGYEFGPGHLEGVTVLFQANNLTDERFGTFLAPDEREVRNWQEYGTTYALRINYRR